MKLNELDSIIVQEDCGIYNVMFKKPLLNAENKVCGTVYVHAPNCTLDNGEYIVYGTDESRTTIAYNQLCDLAKVPYNTSCYELFKALSTVFYPCGYKSNLNQTEKRKNDGEEK
jgi:hypothetical protein